MRTDQLTVYVPALLLALVRDQAIGKKEAP